MIAVGQMLWPDFEFRDQYTQQWRIIQPRYYIKMRSLKKDVTLKAYKQTSATLRYCKSNKEHFYAKLQAIFSASRSDFDERVSGR